MTDNYELAETLGRAAAHEMAAGEMGEYVKLDKLDTHDGEDVSKFLPDYQEVLGHFQAYSGMIDEVGQEANEHVPVESYRDEHLPVGPISEEKALLMGYVLEKMALENANDSIEAAEKSDNFKWLVHGSDEPEIPYSLSDIAREENLEMREIEDLLLADEAYDVSEEELEEIETLEDL